MGRILFLCLLLSLAFGARSRFQKAHLEAARRVRQLFTTPQQDCYTQLLSDPQYTPFYGCVSGDYLSYSPSKTEENNCTVTAADYDDWCSDPCFDIVLNGFESFVENGGPCLNAFNNIWCTADSDCDTPNGEICYGGVCAYTCTTKADCDDLDPCDSDIDQCIQLPGASGKLCSINATTPIDDAAQSIIAFLYGIQLECTKNENDEYCSILLESTEDPHTLDCTATASWGCCAGSVLQSFTYCQHQMINNDAIYQCSNAQDTCNNLPLASTYCIGLCNGDDLLPAGAGTTGTCKNNLTLTQGEACVQVCESNSPLKPGTNLSRVCQNNNRYAEPTAICQGCVGDNAAPVNGKPGTCTPNRVFAVGETCQVECKSGYKVNANTTTLRTCLNTTYEFEPVTTVCESKGFASVYLSAFLIVALILAAVVGV